MGKTKLVEPLMDLLMKDKNLTDDLNYMMMECPEDTSIITLEAQVRGNRMKIAQALSSEYHFGVEPFFINDEEEEDENENS